jgi:hypothetical protein
VDVSQVVVICCSFCDIIKTVSQLLLGFIITMKIYVVTCTFNNSQSLVDVAFKTLKEAKAYAAELNGDKDKVVARCKELIALRDSEAMVKFLDTEGKISFEVVAAELK